MAALVRFPAPPRVRQPRLQPGCRSVAQRRSARRPAESRLRSRVSCSL